MKIIVPAQALRRLALVLLVSVAGCSNMEKPGPESVAGMSPDGTVSLTEIIVAGGTGGEGVLHFQGRSYSFKLVGGVTGGGGASDARAEGEVYNLHQVSDFAGFYTENSGAMGLDRLHTSNIWLRNKAGVVLHVTGTQVGMTLSFGRETVLIEMF